MNRRSALVTVARGVGDIVRITPLVRVCARLGYDVDVLVAPDYADAASLLRGAPEIRRLFVLPSPWNGSGVTEIAGLDGSVYDVAVYTVWTRPYRSYVRQHREVAFDRSTWLAEGDPACVRAAARALGWSDPLPPPFVTDSGRRFDLPPDTVALHPGCKPDWPWKKWHGFDELAARLPHVVVLGTESDLDNRQTYFGRDFAWPAHVRLFVGALDLADTVALLRRCAALVSNDSGLMHIGAAVGMPTYGIFGITSPAREALPVPNMVAVTKALPCEPACRRGAWGRRDCERHLECLRTLAADEVLAVMQSSLPRARRRAYA
jgi:ADP-heptose:LPS heptosyltransferase